MRLRGPNINLGPRTEKALVVVFFYPLGAAFLVTMSPIIILLLLLKGKRILRGPDEQWRKCFAWHPVPIKSEHGWTKQDEAFLYRLAIATCLWLALVAIKYGAAQ